jgi:pyruvate dehydrogenase E1 component
LVDHLTDERLEKTASRRARSREGLRGLPGGRRAQRRPTVILAKTIKGYGLGEAGEGRNVAHNTKK